MNYDIETLFKQKKTGDLKDDIYIFWQLSKPYLGRLVAAVIFGLLLSGINGAIAWLMKPALDSIFIDKSSHFLSLVPIVIIILFLMRGIFTFSTNYLMSSIGAKITKSVRYEIFNKLLILPLSFFNKTSSGSLISKIQNDIELLYTITARTIKDFFTQGSTLIVLAAIAIIRKWDLALLSFVVIPIVVYIIGWLARVIKKISAKTRILISATTTILHESLHGMKIIKAFTMEKAMSERYKIALHEHYKNILREVRTDEFSSLSSEVFGGLGIAMIIFYGGNLVISEEITAGTFFSFVTAILLMYSPLKRLSKAVNKFQQARTTIERIHTILDVTSEKQEGIESPLQGEIMFNNVAFKYPEAQHFALKDINLKISEGEIVALVGYSGSGKSTLVDLVAGFWYPTEGDISVSGISTRDLSLRSLRKHLGIVSQDIILFNDTIEANILFGRSDAAREEVIQSAKAAYAHDFIMELPDGYETKVGERGVKLSGGQKQRITIARAILRNPGILLLDEATSSLDTESELKIQEALEKLMVNRTTIVIAHRLSTVKKASRIVVLDNGMIVQQGSHDELLRQGKLYRQLYTMQFAT
jgi:subfamily B ATP-binding cassette protein MsbA